MNIDPPGARPRSAGEAITEARRQVTILFVDIADSTALFAGLDPEDAAELVHAVLHAAAAIIERHGGTVDKFLGDGVMAKFGAPLAVEDAATRALRAALDVRENAVRSVAEEQARVGWRKPLCLHVGLDTGLVAMSRIVTDDTAMGERVVAAARVVSRSGEDEILVGENTKLAARDEFLFEEVGSVALAKSDARHGSVRSYRLCGLKAQPAAGAGLGTHRPVEDAMVGREHERRRAEAFATGTDRGGAGILLVAGDAGQGKTRLMLHLRSCVPAGVDVVVEPCREEERYAQHAPLSRMLRRLMGGDDVPPQALAARHREVLHCVLAAASDDQDPMQEGEIRAAFAALLRASAGSRPLLLILDDAHWCDDATLSVLFGGFSELGGEDRVSIAAATRPEALGRLGTSLERCVAAERTIGRIELSGLAAGEAVDLIRRSSRVGLSPGAARQIAELSGGNPFCIEEIVLGLNARGGGAPGPVLTRADIEALHIPVRVEDIVMVRVATLEPPVREVLEAASVIGESIPLALLEDVVGDRGRVGLALGPLADGGFLRRDDSFPEAVVVFPHSYRRAAVNQSIPKRRRAALHRATAEALRAAAGADPRSVAALLAHHYAAAGADAEAEEFLLMAGTQAVRSAAGAEGLRHLERAKDLYLRRVGDGVEASRLRLLEKSLGLARLLAGDLVGSVENFDAALRLLGMVIPDGKRSRALYGLRDALGAMTHIRFGLKRRPWLPADQQKELFEILYNRCRAQNPTDAERSAFDNFAAIRQLIYLDRANVPGASSLYASAGAFFAFAGLEFTQLPRYAIDRARAILDEEDPGEKFEVESMAFVVSYLRGDWSEGLLIDGGPLARAMELGLSWNLDVYLGLACERHIKQGRFGEAAALVDRLRLLRDRGGYEFASSNIEANLAYLALERGRFGEAVEAAARFAATRDEATLRVIARSVQARAFLGLGDLAGAGEALADAGRIVAGAGRMPPYYLSAYRIACLEAALGGLGATAAGAFPAPRKLEREALRCAGGVARDRALANRLAARSALRRGEERQARTLAAAAWSWATALSMVPEQAVLAALFGGELAPVAPADAPGGANWPDAAGSLAQQLCGAGQGAVDAMLEQPRAAASPVSGAPAP